MDPALIHLVAEAAKYESEALERRDFEPQRRRFLAHAKRRRLRKQALSWLVPLAAAAAALVLIAHALRPPRALSFEVQGRRAEPRDWLTTRGQAPLDIAFSDGSRLGLTGEARARVMELHSDGASVVLERGALKAAVVHGEKTNWRFDAGPFSVRVLGTKFGLEWDPSRERFAVELAEGSVAISGPKLAPRCVVRAGQRVQIELTAGKGDGPCITLEPDAKAPAKPAVTQTLVLPPTPSAAPAAPSWQVLAARGDYEAAYAAVSLAGFGQLKQRASVRDLMLLADLARYARKSDQATQALLEARQRFPGSAEASQAAFLLGRVAADQERSAARGAEWFALYLSERPGGAFASEALGRLLECQNRAGQLEAARKTAADYLQRYPKGPYSRLARHVVGPLDVGESTAAASGGR